MPVLENPSQAGELHWTGVKVHGWLKEQLGLEVGYSTTVHFLHELGYNLRVPRPWPERQNEEERNIFSVDCALGRPILAWSYGLPTNAGLRAIRGRDGAGALEAADQKCLISETISEPMSSVRCGPATGECSTMIFDGVDTDVFQYYLDYLAQEIPPLDSKRRLLIVDNASWHKAQRLNWHHFEVHYLPGYSPDFNPIERLWLRLKADFFSDFITKRSEQLTQRLCYALDLLDGRPRKSHLLSALFGNNYSEML